MLRFMKSQHFVTFYSPGTFVHEMSTKPIESWDVEAATKLARKVLERHNATPFGFQFSTRERGDDDLDSKIANKSGMYYLGGTVLTLQDVKDRNDPKDRILISNMECNGYDRIIENTNSWRIVQPLNADDVVLDFPKQKQEAGRKGGLATSRKKTRAAKTNGQLGGRPKKA